MENNDVSTENIVSSICSELNMSVDTGNNDLIPLRSKGMGISAACLANIANIASTICSKYDLPLDKRRFDLLVDYISTQIVTTEGVSAIELVIYAVNLDNDRMKELLIQNNIKF